MQALNYLQVHQGGRLKAIESNLPSHLEAVLKEVLTLQVITHPQAEGVLALVYPSWVVGHKPSLTVESVIILPKLIRKGIEVCMEYSPLLLTGLSFRPPHLNPKSSLWISWRQKRLRIIFASVSGPAFLCTKERLHKKTSNFSLVDPELIHSLSDLQNGNLPGCSRRLFSLSVCDLYRPEGC